MKQVSSNWKTNCKFKVSTFLLAAFFILISISNNMVVMADVYGNAPQLLNAATDHLGKTIILEFDQPMNDPSDSKGNFGVKMDDIPITIKSVSLGTENNLILLLLDYKVLYSSISPKTITVSYTKGDVSDTAGTALESFTDASVTNQVLDLELVDYEPDAVEMACEDNGEGSYTVTYELRDLMDYDNVNLAIYFDHGFFRNFADNLSYPYVKFYNKDTGEEVELPNVLTYPIPYTGSLPGEGDERYMEYTDWYFYQISGHAPLGLALKSRALSPDTTYVVEVLKGFAFHTGPINNTYRFEFTTTSDSQYKPYWENESSLSATNIKNTSLNLEWSEASDNHGSAYNHTDSGQYIPNLSYNIYKNGELLTTVDEKTTTCNVTGLNPDTEYVFSVEAVDFAGNKSPTLETNATTSKDTILTHAYTNKSGTEVILAFNKSMKDPTGKEEKFHLSIDGNEKQIDSAKLGTDQQMIILQSTVSVTTGQVVSVTTGQAVTVSYESNDLAAIDGTCVEPFTDFIVNNLTGMVQATENTEIDETGIKKDILITKDTPSSINVTVPKEVTDVVLNVESLMKIENGVLSTKSLPAIKIEADTEIDINPVIINIPQDSIVSSEDTWNGEIVLPTVKENNSVSITPDSGKTATVRSVIEIGSENESLEFDKAVRILIPGEAGKDVGFVRKGVFTKITNELEQDSQEIGDALEAGGEGKTDIGNDLVIWTKHFTSFVTYTQTAVSVGDDSSSDGTQGDDTVDGDTEGDGKTPGAGADLRDSVISDFEPNATLISSTDDTMNYRFNDLVDYRNVEFVWYFTYGFFATFEDNLENCVNFYNKETGEEVNLPNEVTVPITVDNYYMEVTDWWFERISGHCPLGLSLVSKELEPGTTYVIEISKGWEFNNGNKTSISYSFEFTTKESSSNTTPLVAQGYEVDSTSGTFGEAGAKVVIPENAFTGQFNLTIKRVASTSGFTVPQGSKFVGDVVEITKDIEGGFLKPVTISLPFDSESINLEDYDLEIYWWNEDTRNWIPLDNVNVDEENKCVTGEVNHFTKFAILAKMKYYPTDIIGHWAETVLDSIIQKGIMKGYPDHTFKPDKGMTRAEFVAVLVKALNLTGEENIVFDDCKTHWAKKNISIASSLGIIMGKGNNQFNPDDLITREEIAVILNRALELDTAKTSKDFSDQSKIAPWAIEAIDRVCEKGYMIGYPGNTFRPKSDITRAEAAVIINNILSKK